MPSVLRNIIALTDLVVGVPVVTAHGIKVNGVATIPHLLAATAAGFTITADATNITVTRSASSAAAVSIYAERWHSFDNAQPLPSGINSALFPFVTQGSSGAGGMGGAGTTNTIAKFTAAGAIGDSQMTDNGTNIVINAAGSISMTSSPTGFTINGGGLTINVLEVRIDSASSMAFETAAGNMSLTANGSLDIYAVTTLDLTSDLGIEMFGGTVGISVGTNPGEKIGFFATAPIVKPTGVAVTDVAIHAALVALGLIAGP